LTEKSNKFECACCVTAFASSTSKGVNTVVDHGKNPFDRGQVK
jgi:hypothetical protein